MKAFYIMTLVCCFTTVFSQSYYLPTPKDWSEETITFPIEFAPNIPYRGEETLRFSPGWGNGTSEELWSYCFLWWINNDAQITAPMLTTYLEEYYSGLVARNIIKRKIDSLKVIPVHASIKNDLTNKNMYSGTISMLDYMNQVPIVLNVTIQVKKCSDATKKAVFIAVSPQVYAHPIWGKFTAIWQGFKCKS